ncbi:uncharacterized protein PRCAT00005216001 [Priceomyces carsonii]|uniref:uncharacterized protein n=1 Tax=Priceomyces carsonii TaxID=28549 RepID=UPI002ED98F22|nr:unnamed protein product [Priceomyces carsonii]
MGKKAKGKIINKKGLKGALIRHEAKEKLRKKEDKLINVKKENQKLKEKSMKNGNKKTGKAQLIDTKAFIPFNKDEKVLLVGEGDFSFAMSLVEEDFIKPDNLIATSYDSVDEINLKYPAAKEKLEFLKSRGVKLLHDIDATSLVKSLKLNPSNKKKTGGKQLFDDGGQLNKIMFNFPHTGRGMKDVDRNIADHQKLILGYFKSCKEVFSVINKDFTSEYGGYLTDKNNGKIIISVFEGEPYRSWEIKSLGRSQEFMVERSGKFQWLMFPSYHHKRTNSERDTTKPASERSARIYVFSSKKAIDSNKNNVDGASSEED